VTAGVLTVVLYAVPALVWAVIAETAWRDRHARRSRTSVSLAIVSALMALHFIFGMLSELVATDLAWHAPGLHDGLDVAGTVAIVVAIGLFADRGFLWTPTAAEPRGRTWRALNAATCATVLAVIAAEHVVPSAARWLAWLYAVIVTFAYLIMMTLIMVRQMRGRMRRGGWEPGGLAAPRSVDVALMTGGVAVLAVCGGMVLVSFGLGLSHGAAWTLRLLHATLGLAFAAVPAVRILGEVVRRVALGIALAAGATIVYVGGHALGAGYPAETRRLVDVGAILLLVLIGGPGRAWLRSAIERIVFRRDARQAELQELVRTLAPDAGPLACCREALAVIARVMQLRGAAIVLRDGSVAVHGAFVVEPVACVWPRGAAIDRLPARPFAGHELDDAVLREALVEAHVVGVVPLVTPRRRWGHLFLTTGLLGATFIDEDERLVTAFADQLALVLAAADLLARAVSVERALAHAEKLAAIGELSARIAHEIRNPVTAARSLAQQLAREPESPMNAEHAQLIVTELERIERQVAALLRFARREDFHFGPVELGALVRGTLAEYRPRLEAAGVGVDVEADGSVTARADREKMRQVLINLIDNALDALGEVAGTRRLALSVGRRNGTASIRVRDSGPGVPPETLARLFEPFFSLKTNGTGLGLAIVRRTIEAHGGRIEAASPAGEGLIMDVELPLAEGGDEHVAG